MRLVMTCVLIRDVYTWIAREDAPPAFPLHGQPDHVERHEHILQSVVWQQLFEHRRIEAWAILMDHNVGADIVDFDLGGR